MFAGLETSDIPNNLYDTYARQFGVTISGGEESLKAVSASKDEAHLLGLVHSAPLLQIDRVATGLDGRPLEWRLSLCDTSNVQYVTRLK
jgi:GntR family transcriptional regulator